MAALRRAGSPSPKTSGRLRLSSVAMPLTSAPADGGALVLLACWVIEALPGLCCDDVVAGDGSETAMTESHRFRFVDGWGRARGPGAVHRAFGLPLPATGVYPGCAP